MSAGEIAAEFDLTNATISYHLSTLKKADLIFETRYQKYIYYEINTSVFESVVMWLMQFQEDKDEPQNKRTLFLTSTICIILSIVAFALSHMGEASNENYILLYVIAVLLNIVLNLALSIKIASTNGAKALVSLGKWIMPIAGVVYLIPQVYSVLFPAKTMQDTYWYVFIGILFIVSGNYFPKNHINPYIGLKFPWLFNDEEGWYKTHRLGGYTWILAGIVSILHPLHNLVFVTVPLIIFLVGIVPLVYSLVLYFKRKRSN